jgi:hypothetical protein
MDPVLRPSLRYLYPAVGVKELRFGKYGKCNQSSLGLGPELELPTVIWWIPNGDN